MSNPAQASALSIGFQTPTSLLAPTTRPSVVLPSMTPDPDYDLACGLAAVNAELRELLVAVAGELERLACRREADPAGFLARAQRIRARLYAA